MIRLPLRYNIRSMLQRKTRTLLTVAGIAVVVFIAVLMSALSRGLIESMTATGSPLNIIVFSRGAESAEFSVIEPAEELRLRNTEGVLHASPEVSVNTMVTLGEQRSDLRGQKSDRRIVIRGVSPVAPEVHTQAQLVEGRWPARGNELTVGSLAHAKLGVPRGALAIGQSLEFEGRQWMIVGTFEARGTVYDAEAWTNVDDLRTAHRRNAYSVVILRARDEQAVDDLLFDLAMRTDVLVDAVRETEYYTEAAEAMRPVQAVAFVTTIILVIGGTLAGMNTMFNSILGRVREMGVLLVLGWRRRAVLGSFMLESLLLSTAAGIIGVGCGFFLNDLPMAIPMAAFRFVVDPITIASGFALALGIGVFSVILPMWRVARLSAADALRV